LKDPRLTFFGYVSHDSITKRNAIIQCGIGRVGGGSK